MCDTSDILQSSALFLTLSPIPSGVLLYLAVGLLSVSLIVYTLNHNCPSAKLGRLNNAITVVDSGILTQAKAKCMHNYLALADTETRFLRYTVNVQTSLDFGRTKLAVSKLHSRLLETRKKGGWKNYLHNMIAILRGLAMLECEVRDIQMSLLVGIVFWSSLSCSPPIVNVIRSSSKLPTNANSRKTYTKARRLESLSPSGMLLFSFFHLKGINKVQEHQGV
jgi:hypothetical protein